MNKYASKGCPSGFERIGNKCYSYQEVLVNGEGAMSVCNQMNAILAEPSDIDEGNTLAEFVLKKTNDMRRFLIGLYMTILNMQDDTYEYDGIKDLT